MTKNEFWQLVDEIGWGTKTTDYEQVHSNLLHGLTRPEAEEFRLYCRSCACELVKASPANFCCDSWDDTVNHIIGLGKKVYEDHLANPEKIINRMEKGNYVESFGYCVPYSEDYEKKNLDYYNDQVKTYVKK